MKKTTVVCLVVIAALVCAPLTVYSEGTDHLNSTESFNAGSLDAETQHSSTGWMIGGLLGGGLFSWLGTGITVLIASGSSPAPSFVPENAEPASYLSGYQKNARKQNVRSAAISGVIMSTVWTVLVLSAASAQ